MKRYQYIAQQFARVGYFDDVDTARANTILRALEDYVKKHFPRGSGFDNGTSLDVGGTRENRIAFSTAFHHMDTHGGYDGWTEHQIILTPDFRWGFNLRVTGRDRNDIKDYAANCFAHALNEDVGDGLGSVEDIVK